MEHDNGMSDIMRGATMRIRRHGSAALHAALLLALAALPLAAQQPRPLQLGRPAQGTLAASDPAMLSGNGPFHVYALQATQGERLILTLRSGAFDAQLSILHAVGGIHEVLATDDDGGGGTDSRLRWLVPATATYMVVAQALQPGATGGYTLLAERAPATRPVTALPLRIGETRNGILTDESPVLPDEDVFHDLYAFDARAGQELIVALESTDFDAYVEVGHLRGTAVETLASNDDAGEGTNARLRITIPADGRYGIQARGLGAAATGAYTLTLREARLPEPRTLTTGREVTATLGEDGLDQWIIQARAGEHIRVSMRSTDFDTFLAVYHAVDGRLEPVAENDDAGEESTDSLVELTAPAAGRYVIRASAFGGTRGGSYNIRFDGGR